MTKEYFFSPTSKLECELDDDFDTFAENKSIRYLVSNVRSTNAEIYAPEINFYFEKSEDEIREKMQNIKRLYDVRSTVFDYGQDIELSTEVGQRALIVSNETQSDLSEELGAYGFTSKFIDPIHVKEVHGCIGKLRVTAEIDGKIGVLEADQIIWFGAPRSIMGRRGIYDPEVLGRNKTVEEVQSNSGIYSFKNSIKYNHSLCQYHHRKSVEDVPTSVQPSEFPETVLISSWKYPTLTALAVADVSVSVPPAPWIMPRFHEPHLRLSALFIKRE